MYPDSLNLRNVLPTISLMSSTVMDLTSESDAPSGVTAPLPCDASDDKNAPTTGKNGTGAIAIWSVLIVGAAMRFGVALLPERILLQLTWDDAFYYIRVAQNVVNGSGSSFDGLHPTNGYHPLWLLIIAPITVLIDGAALVRVLVLVQATVGVATALVLVRLLRPKLGAVPVVAALSIWWLNPMSVTNSVAGLETAVACLAVLVTIQAAFRYTEDPSARSAVLLGLCIGVSFLARSDSVFASAAVMAWILLRARRHEVSPSWSRLLRHCLLAGATALCIAAPWFLWSLARFGTFEQASSGARPMVLWDIARRQGVATDSLGSRISFGTRSGVEFLIDTKLWLGWPPAVVAVGLIVTMLIWVRSKDGSTRSDEDSQQITLMGIILVAAGVLLVVVHAGIRISPRWYYFEWVRLGLGIMFAGVTATYLRVGMRSPAEVRSPGLDTPGFDTPGWSRSEQADPRRSRRATHALVAIALLAIFATRTTMARIENPEFKWHSTMVQTAEWLRANTDPQDRIVAFNAGFISYFSNREVINLDGVINNSALDALRSRDLGSYICSTGARWYADFDPIMLDEHDRFMGPDRTRLQLEPVKRFKADDYPTYGESELVIYRLSCSG